MRNRQAAVNAIVDGLSAALEDFPVTVNSPQIENLSLPPTHLAAVQENERARENAEWMYVRAWVPGRRGALPPSRERAVGVAFGR